MELAQQIREGLKRIAKDHGPAPTMLAQVKSVDESEETCTLIDEELELADVRLRPVLNGNQSITMFPVVNSWVLALRIEDDESWMIIGVDEIDKMRVRVGDSVFEMNSGFLLERNSDSLGQIMDDLVTNITTIYAPKDMAGLAQIKLRLSLLLK